VTKREKRLQKLRQNPKNVSFDELRQILEAEGFELDHVTGSHYIFRANAGDVILTIVIPFARPVKPIYVKRAISGIDQRREATVETDESENEGSEDEHTSDN
jgi:predicted RNA binding protein YcfA (HicA-like mRNA interferase family)